MALLFCDSFDHFVASAASNSDFARKWQPYYIGFAAANLSNGMSMAQDLTAPGGGNYVFQNQNTGANTYYVFKQIGANVVTGIVGVWFYQSLARVPSGNDPIVLWDMINGVPTEQVSVRFTAQNRLIVTRNGTTLATSARYWPVNTWMFIELKVKIDPSVGTYEVRVNGSSTSGYGIPATTGANTRATANSYFNTVAFGGYANVTNWRTKGFYVCDTSGPNANDFVGPCKVTTIYPLAAGASQDWSPQAGNNLGTINEKYGDSDISFNVSSTVNAVDTFDYEDVPCGSVGSVFGVQSCIYFRQDTGVKRSIAPVTRVSGTNYVGSSVDAASTYLYALVASSVNPATSAAWTIADLNAAEYGYKLIT